MVYIVLCVIAVLVIAFVVWQNSRLVTVRKTIVTERLPEAFDGYKIAVISDLHKKTFGKDNERLVLAIRQADPDIILFPGDLISRFETTIKPHKKFMSELLKTAPVYYTYGNHETDADEQMREDIKTLGMNCLLNCTDTIQKDGQKINFCGVYFESKYYRNEKGGYRGLPKPSVGDIEDCIGKKPEGFTLLLAHNPDYFEAYAKWGVDITFCGHIHGGIVRIGNRGLLHPERKLFPKYSEGVYTIGDHSMVLTAGLGKFRLFNPSEVMLVTLKANKNDNL